MRCQYFSFDFFARLGSDPARSKSTALNPFSSPAARIECKIDGGHTPFHCTWYAQAGTRVRRVPDATPCAAGACATAWQAERRKRDPFWRAERCGAAVCALAQTGVGSITNPLCAHLQKNGRGAACALAADCKEGVQTMDCKKGRSTGNSFRRVGPRQIEWEARMARCPLLLVQKMGPCFGVFR